MVVTAIVLLVRVLGWQGPAAAQGVRVDRVERLLLVVVIIA